MSEDALFTEIIEGLCDDLETIGMFVSETNMAVKVNVEERETFHEIKEIAEKEGNLASEIIPLVSNGSVSILLQMSFLTKDLAWTDQTLDPENFESDQEVDLLLPTREDMIKTYVDEQLEKGVALADIQIPDHLLY
jgi:hypothetical protein